KTKMEQLEPVLERLAADVTTLQALEKAILRSNNQRLSRLEFDRVVSSSFNPAFDGIKMDEDFLSASAFKEFVELKDRRKQVRSVNLAFRLFYLAAGLSSERLFTFLPILKERPMLFMHFAVGRDFDVVSHRVGREEWD